jgi:hypothetical protein
MIISIVVVLQFTSSKYSSPSEAEKAIQAAILSDDLIIADIRYDRETMTFRSIIAAEGIDPPSA